MNKRELFIAGVVLYWAEGFKHEDESGLGLATSDPRMAEFYIKWLEVVLKANRDKDLLLRVTANIAHKDRIKIIEKYWSDRLVVDQRCFSKPFFQRSRWRRSYPKRETYYGVLRIRLRRSKNAIRRMRGWLEGIAEAEML